MGYEKGKLAREQIVEAGASVLLAKGFSATTMADLSQAAQTSAGKLTHHFPTKAALLEAAFRSLMVQFEMGPLACLCDAAASPRDRIFRFFDGVYGLYRGQVGLVGCPLGHAAGDLEDVPAVVKEQSLEFLDRVTALFEKAFADLKESPSAARAKASLFVNAWQGAVVIARAGAGLEHVHKVFGLLKESVEPGC
jgi:TetR/AcrR family transcriptional repressor of nem operon